MLASLSMVLEGYADAQPMLRYPVPVAEGVSGTFVWTHQRQGHPSKCMRVLPQTRPQEATFLASLLQHQPALRPTVDALLRSNLLPALHASLPSRRGSAAAAAAAMPAPSAAISAASASPAAAKLPSATEPPRPAKAEAVTATSSVRQLQGERTDGEAAAKRQQAMAAAAEDKEVRVKTRT